MMNAIGRASASRTIPTTSSQRPQWNPTPVGCRRQCAGSPAARHGNTISRGTMSSCFHPRSPLHSFTITVSRSTIVSSTLRKGNGNTFRTCPTGSVLQRCQACPRPWRRLDGPMRVSPQAFRSSRRCGKTERPSSLLPCCQILSEDSRRRPPFANEGEHVRRSTAGPTRTIGTHRAANSAGLGADQLASRGHDSTRQDRTGTWRGRGLSCTTDR